MSTGRPKPGKTTADFPPIEGMGHCDTCGETTANTSAGDVWRHGWCEPEWEGRAGPYLDWVRWGDN